MYGKLELSSPVALFFDSIVAMFSSPMPSSVAGASSTALVAVGSVHDGRTKRKAASISRSSGATTMMPYVDANTSGGGVALQEFMLDDQDLKRKKLKWEKVHFGFDEDNCTICEAFMWLYSLALNMIV